ncbi:PREDICTED: odorant receptor 4-like [Habropoda laboriosa]|uniref:odorant receptor 4-like n=1 Tax=Habropoda laboriosa TaxID=597456 RepID=UPI00083DFF94|nr:PREDICTED: odorant receptor 4-like [Habropoda laboriosa]
MTNEFAVVKTNFKSYSDYSLQLNRWFLKPIGAWPPSSSTTTLERNVSIVLNIVCYGSILFTLIPCLLHVFLDDDSFYMKVKNFGPMSHWIISCANYTLLLLQGKDIRYCVEHIETDWRMVRREKDQQVMMKNARFGRYVATFCAAIMQSGVFCFFVSSALNTEIIHVGNETTIVRVLPVTVYKKLLNVDQSPTNEIVVFMQTWSSIIATTSTVSIFSLAAVFATHAYGQLTVLMSWITEFVNESRNREKTFPFKQIGVIVEHHLRVLSFISYIEEVMNRICFLELFRCTLAICMLGYYILAEWSTQDIQNLSSYFMILISLSFNIFVICYIGEILTEQCKKVGDVVYMTDWYYLPDKRILDLILVIARSSVVVQITAGKFFHMSIYTFSDVIKTSFAYLNLLRQVS